MNSLSLSLLYFLFHRRSFTKIRAIWNDVGREGSASLEWLINGLLLSFSQLTIPQMTLCLIHLHAKHPFPPLAFPQSSIFHVGFLFRAFRPVSPLMGITHKPLSFWTTLWPTLSVLWLSPHTDSHIICTARPEGEPDSPIAFLYSFFFSISLCCYSTIFWLPFFPHLLPFACLCSL